MVTCEDGLQNCGSRRPSQHLDLSEPGTQESPGFCKPQNVTNRTLSVFVTLFPWRRSVVSMHFSKCYVTQRLTLYRGGAGQGHLGRKNLS